MTAGTDGPFVSARTKRRSGRDLRSRAVVHSSQCEVQKPRLATYLENDEGARRRDTYRLLLQARVRQA